MNSNSVRQFCFQLENVFRSNLPTRKGVRGGIDCIDWLQKSVTKKPMLLLAGDQLTGKTTLGINLSKQFNANYWSVGNAFRQIAKEKGYSAAEFSEYLMKTKSPGVDVEIDYKTCELIAGKEFDGEAGVIEGRQPAFMGLYLREMFQKQNLVSVYLVCNIRERALRYLLREVGPEAREMADEKLPVEKASTALDTGLSISEYSKHIAALPLENIEKIAAEFYENQHRDETDVARYKNLYGIDYRDRNAYDIVIDTSNRSAEENLKQCNDALSNFQALPDSFRKFYDSSKPNH